MTSSHPSDAQAVSASSSARDAALHDVGATKPVLANPLTEKDETVRSPDLETREYRLQARDVCVFYGEKQALFDVSLDVPEKAVTSLIGPSGCGKTTFLRCINRMNDTIEGCRVTGKITLDGEDIYDPSLDVVELRSRVGMVFQNPIRSQIDL